MLLMLLLPRCVPGPTQPGTGSLLPPTPCTLSTRYAILSRCSRQQLVELCVAFGPGLIRRAEVRFPDLGPIFALARGKMVQHRSGRMRRYPPRPPYLTNSRRSGEFRAALFFAQPTYAETLPMKRGRSDDGFLRRSAKRQNYCVPAMKAKRAALYLRVSTDEQTTEDQRQALAAACEQRGWQIVEVYEDAGISGAKGRDKRPGLDRMLKDATRRRFDVVLPLSVDRLGRFAYGSHQRLAGAARGEGGSDPAPAGYRHDNASRQGAFPDALASSASSSGQ